MSDSDYENYDQLLKLLLVGESGVGKTCILRWFVNDDFTLSHLSTIAIDFWLNNCNIDGKKVLMQLWDTAGQERYNTLTSAFFKGSDGILVVFSVCDRRSFENVNKWMGQIWRMAPENVSLLLVGNKIDLKEKRVVS